MKKSNNSFLILAAILLSSCAGGDPGRDAKVVPGPTLAEPVPPAIMSKDRRDLNINILIDLSNRIDPSSGPERKDQQERDLAVINYFAAMFRQNVRDKGAFKANANLRVFFHPEPNDPEISDAARMLVAECRAGNTIEASRRNQLLFRTLDSNIEQGMRIIYEKSVSRKYYPGSDIWRFMKDEVHLKCIRDTAAYRNILVILTDGYMYYKNGLEHKGNRYNHIERNLPHFNRFRAADRLASEFDAQDYGFIPVATDLGELEILVMEVSPMEEFPQDYDIIRRYWQKWFREMNVRRFEIYKTGQPAYIETMLNKYFSRP